MIIFFNDTFIEEEFLTFDGDQFKNSLNLFLNYSDIIIKKRAECSGKIYFKTNESIKVFFDQISDHDIASLFLENLSRLNVKFWNYSTIQDTSFYYYFYDITTTPPSSVAITGKTLAEAAEIKRSKKEDVLTLNLPDLKLSNIHKILVHITSIADPSNISPVWVDCADNENSIALWIDRIIKDEFQYKDYSRAPKDEETCLVNNMKFEKIFGSKFQGRQVFRDKNDNYWYVDNFHHGESAHLEVFDRFGNHIGESELNGEIDYSKKDLNKRLTL